MAALTDHNFMVLEQCRVTPMPANPEVPRQPSLLLTFFDLVFWNFPPVQRLFLFESSVSVSDFLLVELPRLKQTLAAALHHFYPLAGNLTGSLVDGAKPEVVCSEDDFILLTTAVSGDDFHDLASDYSREVARFHPLLPALSPSKDGSHQSVFAIQVTLFPNAGIGIGTTVHHAVADGSSYTHFMKTWATIHKYGESETQLSFDRGAILAHEDLYNIFKTDLLAAEGDRGLNVLDVGSKAPDVVMATFQFTQRQLQKLQRHVESKTKAKCSPYALVCGVAWAGLVCVGGAASIENVHFGFVTGCRARVDPPIAHDYFGNCLGICCVEAKRSDLIGDDGVAAASTAIWNVITGLAGEGGVLRRAQTWVRNVHEYASLGALTVAGSPKLGVYGVEFAWGQPKKVEIVSIERTGALSLAESRKEEGGIELGLVLPRQEMEMFRCFYEEMLANMS